MEGQTRPVVRKTIGPKRKEDLDRLRQALAKIAHSDRAIRVEDSAERGIVISGTGELHLEQTCQLIEREYNVPLNIGEPQVIYLETIRKESEAEGKLIQQWSRICHYGHVKVRVSPKMYGEGFEFCIAMVGEEVPAEFLKSIEDGIKQAMQGGVLAGYPMTDLKVALYGGSYHEVDSNEMAYRIAAAMAFREAARKASPVILEPIMAVEVGVPEESVGAVIGDQNRRRGYIDGIDHRGDLQIIRSRIPLAEMFGYAGDLRLKTSGRATFSMRFLRYEPAPHIGPQGLEGAGVTANLPKRPVDGKGSAAAEPVED